MSYLTMGAMTQFAQAATSATQPIVSSTVHDHRTAAPVGVAIARAIGRIRMGAAGRAVSRGSAVRGAVLTAAQRLAAQARYEAARRELMRRLAIRPLPPPSSPDFSAVIEDIYAVDLAKPGGVEAFQTRCASYGFSPTDNRSGDKCMEHEYDHKLGPFAVIMVGPPPAAAAAPPLDETYVATPEPPPEPAVEVDTVTVTPVAPAPPKAGLSTQTLLLGGAILLGAWMLTRR
jgi:hypothetical protein